MKHRVRRLLAVVVLTGLFMGASAPIASASTSRTASMGWCTTIRIWGSKIPICIPWP